MSLPPEQIDDATCCLLHGCIGVRKSCSQDAAHFVARTVDRRLVPIVLDHDLQAGDCVRVLRRLKGSESLEHHVVGLNIAGESKRLPGWPNLAPSSESDGFWLFPRTTPTVRVGSLSFGALEKR